MARAARGSKRKDIHERALGLLTVRARSRRELERRLLQAGFGTDEVDEELRRLEDVGLIDDESFARQLAEQAFGPGAKGRRAVASALFAKGIEPRLASSTLDEFGGDENVRALELARTRVMRLAALEPQKAYQRLSGFLMRRGYGPEVAHSAARKALAVEHAEGR